MAMTDDELLAAISAAEESALGTLQGSIASDRTDALKRYYGEAYGNEVPGRSSVVSRDVADVVEGVVANVVKPFVGGDSVVTFTPVGPDDEEKAEQETDYVNHIALERNRGFCWMVPAIKDALLLRAGYVKLSWAKRSDAITEQYSALTDEEVQLLLQDGVEVLGHSQVPGPVSMETGQPTMAHDLTVRRSRPAEYVQIDPVPPDEILVSERARGPSLQDVDFVQHRVRKTISELRQAGYDVPDDITDDDSGESLEDQTRQRFGDSGDVWDDNTGDAARRLVLYKETWIFLDRDGDGIAERRRICQVGQTLLHDEAADCVPIASFSAVVVQHQHLGLSIYDLVADLALIKTALLRSYLDNRNLQNNARMAVDVTRANLDDLLVSRPGGVVRVEGDPSSAIFPLVVPDTSGGALQGLEYLDSVREQRTGYTRNSAGIDNDALTNRTMGGMAMQLSQSQLRLEMIARTIAETGMVDVFSIVHALTLKHSTREEKFRRNGKWIAVNPREWSRRSDLTISIGLGTGTPEQQLGRLMALGPILQQVQPLGLVGPEQAYNFVAEAFKLSGYKVPDKYVRQPQKDPQTGEAVEPPPQKPPQVQVEEMRLQAKGQELQATQQADVQKFQATQQADIQKFQAEQAAAQAAAEREAALKQSELQMQLQLQASNDARDAERSRLEHERELQRMAMEDAFKRDQMAQEYAFKQWEAQYKVANAPPPAEAKEKGGDGDGIKALVAAALAPKRAQKNPDGSWSSRIDN